MKKLYFLRHANAVLRGTPGYPNDDRPLTDEGIEKFIQSAKGIKRLVDCFDVIITSPLKRAHETAAILAREMGLEERIVVTDHLRPGSNLRLLLACLEKFKSKQQILLVGHEPDMSALISRFVGSNHPVVTMKKGAFCRVDVDAFPPRDPGQIVWLLQPKLLRKLG
ncbi:MAG: phosphoglycerate mutase family protein [Endomicrobiales bacterium]|jgi:phosphohistidine phosphatase